MTEGRIRVGYAVAFLAAAVVGFLNDFPPWIQTVNTVLILLPVVAIDVVALIQRRWRRGRRQGAPGTEPSSPAGSVD